MSKNGKPILVITFNDPDCHCGGVEDYIKTLYEGLSERNWEVYCLFSVDSSSSISYSDKLKKIGIPLKIPKKKYLVPLRKLEFYLKCSLYIYNNREKFSVVHSNGDNSFLSVFGNNFVKVHTFPGFSVQKANKNSNQNFFNKILTMLYITPSTLIELTGLITAKVAIVDNELLYRRFLNFRNRELILIHNAIDTSCFHPITSSEDKMELRKYFGLSESKNYVIWVGTDPRIYRLAETIDAVLSEKNYDLLVVGVTSFKPDERIKYLGLVDHPRLAEYYKVSDVLVHLSQVVGLDLSVLSALATGIPVIVDQINASLYMPNEFVYSADGRKQLASLLKIIKRDQSQSDTTFRQSHLDSTFTPDSMIDQYEKLFKRLL